MKCEEQLAAENALYRVLHRLFFWFSRFSFISFSNKTSHSLLLIFSLKL